MPAMRVHELAKEFGMSSKELLDKLQELKIPAKNHASTLVEAYVDKIRKSLGPEIAERQAVVAEENAKREAEEAAKAAAEAAARRAEDDARRKAAEEERRRREEEQNARAEAARQRAAAEAEPPAPVVVEPVVEAPAKKAPKARPVEVVAEPVAEVAPVEVVAEVVAEPVAEVAAAPEPATTTKPSRHADLEAAIAAERARLESEEAAALNKEEEDRYRQMAQQAEEIQRNKVIEEAKAAVAAAATEGSRKKKKHKKPAGEEVEEAAHHAAATTTDLPMGGDAVTITEGVTVGDFADALGVPANDVIKRLFMLGSPLTVNQPMTRDTIEIIGEDLGREVNIISPEEEATVQFVFHDEPEDLKTRPPVVTVMGHVDHGKTSLLDAIRETGVAATEAGGITQHIGASVVNKNGRHITFIDTPGHEAFTAMRARGANATDVVVLVVAADDGVMPQTVEAIHHAKAAGVPIIVAVNKIDKDGANPEQVRQMLTEYEIVPEEWGGTNIFVNVSAKKRIAIDDLLEMILLQADILELKANPDALASGIVIEAKLDKGRGPVTTVLVQRGTLRVGDAIVAGTAYGRVRALVNPLGENVDTVTPAEPVEIQGLASVPSAGDEFRVFADERDARNVAEERALKLRTLAQGKQKTHVSLDDLFARISEGELKDLNLVVKADVHGSIEALKDALDKMDQTEVRINVIHSAVGAISESDVQLADASDAIIIGFNVRPQPKAKALAEQEGVDIRLYRVIYQAIEDINAARVGLLAPEFHEEDTARVEIRELFRVPKLGVIAGCYVVDGEINRDDKIRIVRDGTIIQDGTIHSLRRFKEDVKSVRQGFECGIGIEGFQDLKEGDIIEGYKIIEVAREA
ncbi:MAG: translation initiation factor IF-2 [Coriobacteriia bacterium]|nr:translation initiation factor IF-2 [Coriobacteriia bacterium]